MKQHLSSVHFSQKVASLGIPNRLTLRLVKHQPGSPRLALLRGSADALSSTSMLRLSCSTSLPGYPSRHVVEGRRTIQCNQALLCLAPLQGGTGIVTGESVDCVLPAVAALADAMLPSFVKRGPPAGSRPSLASSTLRLVHRLDREVGGVLLLARTRTAAAVLSAAFSDTSASGAQDASPSSDKRAQGAPAAPTLRKTYFAIVAAPLPPGTPSRGDIAAPVVSLDDDGSGSTGDSSSGQAAATVYSAEVLRLRPSLGPGAAAALPPAITVLHLQPLTGRKHQLRQHVLRLFGGRAAILGDARYTPLVLGGRAGRAAQGAPTAAFELVLPPASDQADPATDAGGSVSSRPASAALRRRGLPLDSGLLAGIPPSPGDAPPPAAWLCRQLCLHAHKVELGAALVDRLSPGGGDVPTASGARPQRPLVVRSPLPWPMRALLACYAEKS